MNTQIYEEASEWIVLHRLGELDAQARRRFDAWLRQSPQHVSAYLNMSSIWEGIPQIDASLNPSADELIARALAGNNVVSLDESRKTDSLPVTPSVGLRQRSVMPRVFYSLAATLIVAVGIAGWLYLKQGIYATGIGEQRTVTLVDGSVVELNAKSRIRVRYSDHERAVDLLQGQALFRVAKDPTKPFTVDSDGTQVRAVGTQFDVNRKSAGTIVTVVEGRVAVTAVTPSAQAARSDEQKTAATTQRSPDAGTASPRLDQPSHGSAPNAGAPQGLQPKEGEVLLGAGEQLLVAQAVMSAPKPANVEAITAWTQQRLVFDYTPLTEVAEEFNRYNHRRLVIEDDDLRAFHVSGSFSSTDPTLLLRFLRDQPGILVSEEDGEIRISRRESGAG